MKIKEIESLLPKESISFAVIVASKSPQACVLYDEYRDKLSELTIRGLDNCFEYNEHAIYNLFTIYVDFEELKKIVHEESQS